MRSRTTWPKRAMTKAAKVGRCEKAIRDYFGGVLDGSIVACRKIKQVAEKILRDMDNQDPLYPYHFREEYASKHVGFIERFCRLPSGKLGHAFKLELFQLAILSVIFGFVDAEGLRQYREVLWVMGAKTAKRRLRLQSKLTCRLTTMKERQRSTTLQPHTIRPQRASTTHGA